MSKRWSGWVLCVLFVFVMGVGCSGIAPSQVAPSQSADSNNGDKNLYKHPEHDFKESRMD
ncbi:hypothetical protein [Nitrospina watsonii]|uniref:Uncharacterized protein n=1 Tax=Nitrospina watsonii TaxID=1323948 RepID=A0ABM9HBX1_9BACT|nr:hypothetical protein [Nitrospina watsonii]CAI2717658.1 conserved protein of unknown function [Nitrospina watsonii]